jgi:hypothetical protein
MGCFQAIKDATETRSGGHLGEDDEHELVERIGFVAEPGRTVRVSQDTLNAAHGGADMIIRPLCVAPYGVR